MVLLQQSERSVSYANDHDPGWGGDGAAEGSSTPRRLQGPSYLLQEFGSFKYVSLWNGPETVSFSPYGSGRTTPLTLDLLHNLLLHPSSQRDDAPDWSNGEDYKGTFAETTGPEDDGREWYQHLG